MRLLYYFPEILKANTLEILKVVNTILYYSKYVGLQSTPLSSTAVLIEIAPVLMVQWV